MIQLALVDDHVIVRDGLKALFESNDAVNVVGEFGNGWELLNWLEAGNRPDIVLMDINMPVKNGIETTEILADKFPDIPVLALTIHDHETYIAKMLNAGAKGYILKNALAEDIAEAIMRVTNGESYFSEGALEAMFGNLHQERKRKDHTGLKASLNDITQREREVLTLIASEYTNNEIAVKLSISPRTVDTHRKNLLSKLGVKNTAGMVRFAIQHSLLE